MRRLGLLALAVALSATSLPAGSAAGPISHTLLEGTPPHECDVRGLDPTGAAGCHDWVARYDSGNRDDGLRIEIGPAGETIYVAGSTGNASPWEEGEDRALLFALDAQTGERLWTATYRHQDIPSATFQDIAVSPDGDRVYVTGWGEDPLGPGLDKNRTAVTLAYEADTGQRVWTSDVTGSDTEALHLEATPDGDRLVVAIQWQIPGEHGSRMQTIGYEASTGTEAWNRSYVDPDTPLTDVCCLALSPDGKTAYVSGNLFSEGAVTVAYGADAGTVRWVGNVPGVLPYSSDATGERVLIVGVRGVIGHRVGSLDAATGAMEWKTQSIGRLVDVAGAADAGLALAAGQGPTSRPSTVLTDVATLRAFHVSNGSEAWSYRYDPGFGEARFEDVEVGPGGDVAFVTGSDPMARTGKDYLTAALDLPDGTVRWMARYNAAPGSWDAPYWNDALAVGPAGERVAVTGWSEGLDTTVDVGVVSYETPPPTVEETADFLLPAEATVTEDAEDREAAASLFGDATCRTKRLSGPPCVAASATGDAQGGLAVSGTGNASGNAAVSGTGDATCERPAPILYPFCPAVSGAGEADGEPGIEGTDVQETPLEADLGPALP